MVFSEADFFPCFFVRRTRRGVGGEAPRLRGEGAGGGVAPPPAEIFLKIRNQKERFHDVSPHPFPVFLLFTDLKEIDYAYMIRVIIF